ncbi:MAG TPA: hypothetical protein VMM13_06845 [Euzebya sp.]|nr:hypothetical protein [Euzebya sp.]
MPRLALLLIVFLVACSPQPGQQPTVAATAPPPSDPVAGGSSATPAMTDALAFSADLVDGGTFDGGAYAGQDLMIWFWAPW